jgi:hypothetical protein
MTTEQVTELKQDVAEVLRRTEEYLSGGVTMKAKCEDCGVNLSMHMIEEGGERKSLCDVCLKDYLYDIAINAVNPVLIALERATVNGKSEAIITIS